MLRNHPGWGKGALVLVRGRTLAEVITDGLYTSDTFSGLWHYKIKLPDGSVVDHIPLAADQLVRPVDRSRG